MRNIKNQILFVFFTLVLFCGTGYSQEIEGYTKKIIIKGPWGTSSGQFGYKMWEGEADYPKLFVVDNNENIYILDKYNNRVQMFNDDGKFIKEMPIESFKLSSKEEIANSKKTWNKLGNPFSVIDVNKIDLVNGKIYASKEIYSNTGIINEIYINKNNKFSKINNTELSERQKFVKKDNDHISNIVNERKKFTIKKVNNKDSSTYDNEEVRKIFLDSSNNLFVLNKNSQLKKYDTSEKQLFELNTKTGYLNNPIVITKNGNIYLLKLYSETQPEKEGTELSIEEYSGIEIIKWGKNEK